ncbi:MAG: ANTAR domain-containing response regulator [Bacillota bacterium]
MYRAKIFVASGDNDLRKKIKTFLQPEGYIITGEAEDGPSALRALRTMATDLVILDSDLPGISGWEVARIIEDERIAAVLLISPTWQREMLERAKEQGIKAFLIKPVSEQALLPAVETTMMNYRKMADLEREVAELKETLESRKIVEKAKGILMQSMGMTEAQAFRRIQQQSMNKSLSMRAVAEAIVLANDIRKK